MIPAPLKKNDWVAFAAPARSITMEQLKPAIQMLEKQGLNVLIPEGLFEVHGQMAGTDEHRAALFQKLLDDDNVRAIICVRGGYGTVRIIDRLDFSSFIRKPKWIVGYSDITVLHSHISRQCNIPTIHGTMAIDFPLDAGEQDCPSLASLWPLLRNEHICYNFDNKNIGPVVKNRIGTCTAPIVGGNLSILYSLLASSSDITTDDKILLIEDLDEYLYHIDRMMMALKRSGKLSRLKGLIVGAMTKMHDNEIPFGRTAEEIVRDAVAEYDYPVAYGCSIGHIGADNIALPLGMSVSMQVLDNKTVVSL